MGTNVISTLGRLVIRNNTASVPVYFNKDAVTEGTETFTFKILKSAEYALPANISSTVTVYDNSIARTVLLTTTAVANTVNEGESYVVNIYTTEMEDGVRLFWQIDGVNEYDILTPLSGNVVILNNYANVRVSTVRDRNTEGSETIYFRVLSNTDPAVEIANNVYANITLVDTSKDPTYNLISNVAVVGEGGAVEFMLITANLENNVIFSYGVEGITQNDLSFGSITGKVRHNSYNSNAIGNANVVLRLAKDLNTEGIETLRFNIFPDTSIKLLTNLYANVSVTDNSRTPVYSVFANVSQVQEGDAVLFTLLTENVDNNVAYSYVIENISPTDIEGGTANLSGDIINISNDGGFTGSATKTINFVRDKTTEGTEFLVFKVLSNPVFLLNTNVAVSVNILDISRYPSVAIVPDRTDVRENGTIVFNIIGNDIETGVRLNYTISNSTDVNNHVALSTYTGSSGVFEINSAGVANVVVNMKEDFTTEGTEFLTFTVLANTSLNIDSSAVSIPILDTSLTPALNFTLDKNPVNEGDVVTVTVTGTNVPNGTTIAWSITSNPLDVTPNIGSIKLFTDPSWPTTSNTIVLTANADLLTEGWETVVLTTGAISAINLPSRTVSINIKDTSIASPPPSPAPAAPAANVVNCSSPTILSEIGSKGPGWHIFDVDCGDKVGTFSVTLDFLNNFDFAELEWNGYTANTGIRQGVRTLSIEKSESIPNSIRLQINRNSIDVANPGQYLNGEYAPGGWWVGSGWSIQSIVCPSGTGAPIGPLPPYTPLPDGSVTCPVLYNGSSLTGTGPFINNVASVTGSLNGTAVWGNNQYGYTDDSDFRRAVVHAGLLAPGQTTDILFTPLGFKTNYPGSTANGITTSAWSSGWCGITLSLANPVVAVGYAVAPDLTIKNEGALLTYTITTTNVPDGTQLYYEMTGLSNADYYAVPYFDIHTDVRAAYLAPDTFQQTWGNVPADFVDYHYTNYGEATNYTSPDILANVASARRFVINNGLAYLNFYLIGDNLTEGTETANLVIKTGAAGSTGNIVKQAAPVTINDTSQTLVAVYNLTAYPSSSEEGSNVAITIAGTNVDFGTVGRWFKITASGAGIESTDVNLGTIVTGLSGLLTGLPYEFTLEFTADQNTEGIETMTLDLTTWLPGETESTTSVSSTSVNIADTSVTPPPPSGVTVTTFGWDTLNSAQMPAEPNAYGGLIWDIDPDPSDITYAEVRYSAGTTYDTNENYQAIRATNASFKIGNRYEYPFFPGSLTNTAETTFRLLLTKADGTVVSPPYDLTWYQGAQTGGA